MQRNTTNITNQTDFTLDSQNLFNHQLVQSLKLKQNILDKMKLECIIKTIKLHVYHSLIKELCMKTFKTFKY